VLQNRGSARLDAHGHPTILSRAITSSQVIDYFAECTGDALELQARSPGLLGQPPFELLALSEQSKKPYGDFRIDVFRDAADAAQVAIPDGSHPDQNGIHWTWLAPEHRGDRGIWLAAKVYANVALYWWPEQRVTDPRWHRLDAILAELAQARRH